jgi:hypothetical protein
MKTRILWWAIVVIALGETIFGCASSKKGSSSSTAGINRNGSSLHSAVERDSFSSAPNMSTAGKSSTVTQFGASPRLP